MSDRYLCCSVGCSDSSSSCRAGHCAADDHHTWAGEAKAEFKTALAPAAIIALMAITFLSNGVAPFPPESLRQAVVNAQLLLLAHSR
jgi:hypothetical protein